MTDTKKKKKPVMWKVVVSVLAAVVIGAALTSCNIAPGGSGHSKPIQTAGSPMGLCLGSMSHSRPGSNLFKGITYMDDDTQCMAVKTRLNVTKYDTPQWTSWGGSVVEQAAHTSNESQHRLYYCEIATSPKNCPSGSSTYETWAN